jgi:nucleotide-binding universal stress UspA family protein
MSRDMKTILVGYDESAPGDRALSRAADLAEALGARLVVACITNEPLASPVPTLSPDAVPPLAVGTPGAIPVPPEAPADRPGAKELAQHHVERARMALAQRRLAVEYVADTGNTADGLLDLAETQDADLIVVGSREHGFLDRLLGRGVDETVAERSTRDVLLVR